MAVTQPLRRDQRQALAHCLSLAEAKNSAGSRVPRDDDSIGVRHDHGVTEHIEQLRKIKLIVHRISIRPADGIGIGGAVTRAAHEKKEAPIWAPLDRTSARAG